MKSILFYILYICWHITKKSTATTNTHRVFLSHIFIKINATLMVLLLSFVARYLGVNTVFRKIFCQVIHLEITGSSCLSSYIFCQPLAVENFG